MYGASRTANCSILQSTFDSLHPGGRFVAELGGAGNVSAIVDAVLSELSSRGYDAEHPWYFPTMGEYITKLEAHGFEARYATLFDRPTELDEGADGLAAWLDMFGASLLSSLSNHERQAIIAAVEDRLRDDHFENGVWIADYRRLRVVATRLEE